MPIDRVVAPGDVVRFEQSQGKQWFYCRVERLDEGGGLVCSVVDAQSWADLALEGFVPGRAYHLPRERVLSVVRRAPR